MFIFLGLMNKTQNICSSLGEKKDAIAKLAGDKVLKVFREVESRYGKSGVERTREDLRFHLEYLHSAICLESKTIFLDYMGWLKTYFKSIDLPDKYIIPPFIQVREAISEIMDPGECSVIFDFLDYAMDGYENLPDQQTGFLESEHGLNLLARQYLQAPLRKEREEAEKLIMDAVKQGTPVRDIYMHVFQPVQWEIGRLWQHNEITVAMEHYITAATEFIMSRLYPFIFTSNRIGKKMVATSISGELHELGIRMVTDFFEIAEWDTYYLGANTPHQSIIDMIRDTGSQLLAISATIPYNLPGMVSLISSVRAEMPKEKLRILVGGKPFNENKDLWKKVGADGFALDADSAIAEATRLVG